ncbi:MAG: hypothetical protein AAF383_15155 [Cyanobacteria bacterium P01_A01_bin.83]
MMSLTVVAIFELELTDKLYKAIQRFAMDNNISEKEALRALVLKGAQGKEIEPLKTAS